MKIFGWMHKKLQLGTTEYHRVAHRNSPDVLVGEKGTMLAAHAVKERETEAPLLPHVLLTIGTFGHFSDPHQQQQQQVIREEEPVSTDHDEDLNPASQQKDSLIVSEAKPTATTALAAHLHSEVSPKPAESAEVEQSLKKVQEVVIAEEEITSQEPLLKEDKEKIEKRTTLADLFAAETASAAAESPDAATSTRKQQTTASPTKKAKKTKKGEESPTSAAAAAKKIHRLITRMLKKRIHPNQLARGEERHAGRGGASDGGEERRRGPLYRLP